MTITRSLLRDFNVLGLGCLLLGALPAVTLADSDNSSASESRQPLLRPSKLVSASGNVQNAEALVSANGGFTTLTWSGQSPAPMVILDYGGDVGGLPVFEVSSASGTPQLQAIYSECSKISYPPVTVRPAFPMRRATRRGSIPIP